MLTRYRVQLMGHRTRDVTRLTQMLDNIWWRRLDQALRGHLQPLHGLGAGDALGDGRRPSRSGGAGRAGQGKMRAKIPARREALDGHFTDAHARLVVQMLPRLDRVEQALAELDELI